MIIILLEFCEYTGIPVYNYNINKGLIPKKKKKRQMERVFG